jgi:hypothetical protein
MTLSIPSNFIKLAAAVEIAAEDWFPGQFLLTFVEPAEREQMIKFDVVTHYSDQPRTDDNAAHRSLLHNIEVEPSLSSLAKFEALQEKLKRHQQLLRNAWHRFHQLLYWGELRSKILTDDGRVVEIPASLWLGEFGKGHIQRKVAVMPSRGYEYNSAMSRSRGMSSSRLRSCGA